MKLDWIAPLTIMALAGRIEAQAIFQGEPGGVGDVVLIPDGLARPAGLRGIRLLPIDCVGRTRSTILLPEHACLVEDVPGASRLLLPGGGGSLYRFARTTSWGLRFGLFRVREGRAETVLELPGAGTDQAIDPLRPGLAVSSDGQGLLVATTSLAGGDLIEVDLSGVTTCLRTGDLAPRHYGLDGLALLPDWGFALSATGPLRFGRAHGARIETLSTPDACGWFGEDVVASRDGSTVAFLAGHSPDEAHVYVCRSTGPIVRVTTAPDRLAGAGFLPGALHGPNLALSTDGSRVAWTSLTDDSRECWVAAVGAAPEHLTADERFDDTLNDAGVISFFDPDSLVILVGEGQDIGEGDLYRVDLDGLAIENLTGTSGILQPPHDYGTVVAVDGVHELPGRAGWLLLDSRDNDDTSGDNPGRLLRVGVDGTVRVLLEDVETLERVERAGSFVAAVVGRSHGVDVPGEDSQNVVQFALEGDTVERLVVPLGTRITRLLGSRGHDQVAVIASHDGGEWLGQVRMPSTSGLVVSNRFLHFGPTLAHDLAGNVYASLRAPPRNTFFVWTGQAATPLHTGPGFVLPGE